MVKLYTSSEYLNGVNQEAVSNTAGGQKYRISDKVQFFKNIYKMSAFYAFPQIIKQYFWFYGDDFAACQAPKNNNVIQYELLSYTPLSFICCIYSLIYLKTPCICLSREVSVSPTSTHCSFIS